MVLLAILQQAANDDPEQAGQASFFGFIGIASALVFASKIFLPKIHFVLKDSKAKFEYRSRSRLRNCQIRSWYRLNGCSQARTNLQIHCPSYYGWYLGYLWFDYFFVDFPKGKKFLVVLTPHLI